MRLLFLAFIFLVLSSIAFASDNPQIDECKKTCCSYAEGTWDSSSNTCTSPADGQYYTECSADCVDAYASNSNSGSTGCCMASFVLLFAGIGAFIVSRN